jgi:transposase
MIQITPQMRILVAVEAVDFRNGIDGLARVCKQQLRSDPFSGALFVFCNRRRTALKILVYDGQGSGFARSVSRWDDSVSGRLVRLRRGKRWRPTSCRFC